MATGWLFSRMVPVPGHIGELERAARISDPRAGTALVRLKNKLVKAAATLTKRLAELPAAEWWDLPLLRGTSYAGPPHDGLDGNMRPEEITHYVEHPVPVEPPCEPPPARLRPSVAVTPTPSAAQLEELRLAREVFEAGAFLSIRATDIPSFERHVAQLKVYYTDCAGLLPQSPKQLPILGLNLLRLLAQNRIAEFHTELELVPAELQSDAHIRYSAQLEEHIMEGSYNKVLAAKQGGLFAREGMYFMDLLVETVRDEIADCSEKAYASIASAELRALLMLGSDAELETDEQALALSDMMLDAEGSFARHGKMSLSALVESFSDPDVNNYDYLKRGLIHPHSGFRRLWDFATMYFVMYTAVVLPYFIAFDCEELCEEAIEVGTDEVQSSLCHPSAQDIFLQSTAGEPP